MLEREWAIGIAELELLEAVASQLAENRALA